MALHNTTSALTSRVRFLHINLLNINTVLTPQLAELINGSTAINSTAFEDSDPESGIAVFIESKTETAL